MAEKEKGITSLTQEQLDKLPEIRDRWLKIGLCTDPVEKQEAKEGVILAYKAVDLEPPSVFLFYDSPLQGMIVCNKLRKIEDFKDEADLLKQIDAIPDPKKGSLDFIPAIYGQHYASWLGFYEAMAMIGCKGLECLKGIELVAKSAGWWWAFEKVAVITGRPKSLHLDERSELHNEDGPALDYGKDFAVYSVHGVRVPSWIIEHPEQITTQKIEDEHNVEIRRVMMEKYGRDKFIEDAKFKEVDRDDFGILYKKAFGDDHVVAFVKVVNTTPEPDGVFKDYFLRVPPDMKDAKEAVAWTFRCNKEDYKPDLET